MINGLLNSEESSEQNTSNTSFLKIFENSFTLKLLSWLSQDLSGQDLSLSPKSYAYESAKQMIIKDLNFRENTQKENW